MSVSREVYLVLYGFEEHLRSFCPWVIVDAERVNLQHLAIEYLFGRTNIADSAEKLIEIIAASRTFQQVIIHRKSFDKVFP